MIQSVHKDWAKKVMYVPNYDAFISCSMDQETSLYFGRYQISKYSLKSLHFQMLDPKSVTIRSWHHAVSGVARGGSEVAVATPF